LGAHNGQYALHPKIAAIEDQFTGSQIIAWYGKVKRGNVNYVGNVNYIFILLMESQGM